MNRRYLVVVNCLFRSCGRPDWFLRRPSSGFTNAIDAGSGGRVREREPARYPRATSAFEPAFARQMPANAMRDRVSQVHRSIDQTQSVE
jgi:hypothetical protein